MLFGSVAKGSQRIDSDIDIGIIPEAPELSLTEELTLQTELGRVCGRQVDLVRLDRASTILRWQVVRHGRPLLERERFVAARFAADVAAEYLDFAPAFEHAAENFRRVLAGRGRATWTDKSAIFRKLTSLREHVARMRRRRGQDFESFKLDVDRQDAIGMSLLVAVQDALDIALHMASDEGWGVAASYAESFGLLASHEVIDPTLAAALANLASLRNRLAHGYGTVDMERIWTSLPDGLTQLDAFAASIAKHLGED